MKTFQARQLDRRPLLDGVRLADDESRDSHPDSPGPPLLAIPSVGLVQTGGGVGSRPRSNPRHRRLRRAETVPDANGQSWWVVVVAVDP
jgi:hypothetical protein